MHRACLFQFLKNMDLKIFTLESFFHLETSTRTIDGCNKPTFSRNTFNERDNPDLGGTGFRPPRSGPSISWKRKDIKDGQSANHAKSDFELDFRLADRRRAPRERTTPMRGTAGPRSCLLGSDRRAARQRPAACRSGRSSAARRPGEAAPMPRTRSPFLHISERPRAEGRTSRTSPVPGEMRLRH